MSVEHPIWPLIGYPTESLLRERLWQLYLNSSFEYPEDREFLAELDWEEAMEGEG